MSEMIERAARAIAVGRGIDPDKELTYGGGKVAWKYFTDDASAVMESMRDPADDMIWAAIGASKENKTWGEVDVLRWQAMIDVALK